LCSMKDVPEQVPLHLITVQPARSKSVR
jgi:hypothetical protein